MAKAKLQYVCQSCGHASPKWLGRCPACGEWNTFVEEVQTEAPRQTRASVPAAAPVPITEVLTAAEPRMSTGVGELDRVLGGGLVPGSLVLIGGDPGIGKCVTADTRVLDPISGAYLPITKWTDADIPVLSLNPETYRFSQRQVVAFQDQGIHPVMVVRTKLGRILRCTLNHALLTPDGWQPAGELSAGTRIATPRSLPYFGSDAMEEHDVKAIACFLSDGSTTRQSGVTSGKTAAEKAVPECIFRLPRGQLLLFLRVLFSCDGSLYVNRYGPPGISYSTVSRRLAEDVQHLLLRFGFIAKLGTTHERVRGSTYPAYELQLLGVLEVKRFLSEIGILGRDGAKARIETLARPLKPSTRSDPVPTGLRFLESLRQATSGAPLRRVSKEAGVPIHDRRHDRLLSRKAVSGLAAAYPSPYFEVLGGDDIYWDEIETVAPAGEDHVYDISVEFDRNFVANDLILHNSTLLLQTCQRLASAGRTILYVSGEESVPQIKLRAQRLGAVTPGLLLLAENDLESILQAADRTSPQALVVDSIQTVYKSDLPSAPGSVAQVRECTADLLRMAKSRNVTVLLVGHVTKEGQLAGPRVLEHIVDTVLYFEGDRHHAYRILRATKNRFGSTNEIGVFEMRTDGLREVTNPSAAFLSERAVGAPGSAVVCAVEGTRPLLIEVQALVTPTVFGMPRRTAAGVDYNRMIVLLAVLEKRAGLHLASQDVYVSVAGGVTVDEPAVDLGIAAAVASSLRDKPVDAGTVAIGEVGLSGEIRAIPQAAKRLVEAARLGFKRCVLPRASMDETPPPGMELIPVDHLAEALAALVP